MIVDTSAVLTILFNESDAETYARVISEAAPPRMSVASFAEAAVVVEAFRPKIAGAATRAMLE
jgi:uncharacterized protein with PIN domain